MIEVVFGDSACGSLKCAQHFGKGKYIGGVTDVLISHSDGSKPTRKEIRAAKREFDERERLKWENATPMEGKSADVYSFNYCLSIGDISENVPGEQRQQVLEWLYSIYPFIKEEPTFSAEMVQKGRETLKEVCDRILAKENVRIWYSNQPDELCGMYWVVAQLNQLELQSGQVILVQLPDWETDDRGMVIQGWGGVDSGDWHRHLELQRVATPAFCKACAAHWQRLQEENALLRALLNGRLVSVSEAFYDEFITREIVAEAEEFHEARLIGRIMGKYELGVGDTWIAQRIESMIRAGILSPATEPDEDSPIFHRKLRKCSEIVIP